MLGPEYYICRLQLFELLGKVRFFLGGEGWSLRGERSFLCKFYKGKVTHLFQNILLRLDKLPQNTGKNSAKRGLEKRVLSPF